MAHRIFTSEVNLIYIHICKSLYLNLCLYPYLYQAIWGVLVMGPFLGVLVIRIIICWGSVLGSPFLETPI